MEPNAPGVCIIVENEPVPFDQRTWQEARALRDAGFHVAVICPKGHGTQASRETLQGIEIYRHRIWPARGHFGYLLEYFMSLVAEFFLAAKAYSDHKFQILEACNPPDITFLVALAFKPLGVRFVFDHHDLSPELYAVKFNRRGLVYRLIEWAERWTFQCADLSLATNESFREIAIARGGMRPDRVVVVQTCADLREVNGNHPDPKLKGDFRNMVLYVGVMESQDGLQLLLESIEHLVKEKGRKDTRFVLIGEGTEYPELKRAVARKGLDKFVEFTGELPHSEVGHYLISADVCVAPDPLNELNDRCTMIKNLEYMAYRKPVVLFDLQEGRRTLGDGALYARPNDPIDFAKQIEQLLDCETLRKTLGDRNGERARNGLNWQVQGEILTTAFRTLLSKN